MSGPIAAWVRQAPDSILAGLVRAAPDELVAQLLEGAISGLVLEEVPPPSPARRERAKPARPKPARKTRAKKPAAEEAPRGTRPPKGTAAQKLLDLLTEGPRTTADAAEALGVTGSAVRLWVKQLGKRVRSTRQPGRGGQFLLEAT